MPLLLAYCRQAWPGSGAPLGQAVGGERSALLSAAPVSELPRVDGMPVWGCPGKLSVLPPLYLPLSLSCAAAKSFRVMPGLKAVCCRCLAVCLCSAAVGRPGAVSSPAAERLLLEAHQAMEIIQSMAVPSPHACIFPKFTYIGAVVM